MGSYGLNPNGLLDSSDELDGITRNIQTAIEELNSSVNTYIVVNSGEAQAAFTNAQAKWNAGIGEMQRALAEARIRLNEIHDRYRLGDVKGAGLFDGHV